MRRRAPELPDRGSAAEEERRIANEHRAKVLLSFQGKGEAMLKVLATKSLKSWYQAAAAEEDWAFARERLEEESARRQAVLDAQAALKRLLKGTRATARRIDARTWRIERMRMTYPWPSISAAAPWLTSLATVCRASRRWPRP